MEAAYQYLLSMQGMKLGCAMMPTSERNVTAVKFATQITKQVQATLALGEPRSKLLEPPANPARARQPERHSMSSRTA